MEVAARTHVVPEAESIMEKQQTLETEPVLGDVEWVGQEKIGRTQGGHCVGWILKRYLRTGYSVWLGCGAVDAEEEALWYATNGT